MERDDATYDADFDAELSAYLESVAGRMGVGAEGSAVEDPAAADAAGSRAPEGSLHVLEVLKCSDFELTEAVTFRGRGGDELGPFVYKEIDATTGLGTAYDLLFRAQRCGLRSPNLPRIAACSNDGKKTRVLMERLPGRTLEDYVRAAGASVELAQDAIAQVAAAAGCLHAGLGTGAPLIHRDLKPSNVMVVGGEEGIDRTFVVIDLGIARAWRPGAYSDTLKLGTRSYAPPEQFGFGQTSVRSDVYALGALLYFCLTGEDPEPGRAAEALARRPGVPPELAQVVARAMSFDPEGRYASAADLADAVRRAAAGEADDRSASNALQAKATAKKPYPQRPAAPRPSSRRGATRWLGRAWNAVVLLGTALVVIAGVYCAFIPAASSAVYPLWFRCLEFIVWLLPNAVWLGYILLDKRHLRSRFPAMGRRPLIAELARFAGVSMGSLLLLAILGMATGVL